jgi:hypothetical protein
MRAHEPPTYLRWRIFCRRMESEGEFRRPVPWT